MNDINLLAINEVIFKLRILIALKEDTLKVMKDEVRISDFIFDIEKLKEIEEILNRIEVGLNDRTINI